MSAPLDEPWVRVLSERYTVIGPARLGEQSVLRVESGGAAYHAQHLPHPIGEKDALLLRALVHAGLPRVADVWTGDFGTVILTAALEGETLGELVASGRYRSDEPRTLGLMAHTADILRFLHGLRPPVIHRAVHPNNLLLSAHGTLVLLGIEHATDHPRGMALGTARFAGAPGYTPFEQYEGRAVPASDIYALGASFLHVLTGTPPLDAPRSGVGLDLGALGLGQRTAELLAACLALDPAARPTADDVISLATEALEPPPPRTFPPRPAVELEPLPTVPAPAPAPRAETPAQPAEPGRALDAPRPRAASSARPSKAGSLDQMWLEVMADPADAARHQRFITYAVEAGLYQPAAQKYSDLERERPDLAEAAGKYKREIGTRAAAKIVVSLPREDHRRSFVATGAWIALGLGGVLLLVAAATKKIGLLAIAVPMVLLGVSLYARSRSENAPPVPKRRGPA